MRKIALQIENISKQYRLGEVGTGTLSHDLNRWWSKIRGKEDPFAKVGMVNDRSQEATEDYIWALKNINLEVEQGEILGIIGNNGAGKSTLLKILSRVTSPTTGAIRTKGRVASLLEVGTGFHAELTGRENIYLNGTILGMTKAEVRSKLDEIIEFAGIAMYVDTPVKRYSSGMKVRLGFAVAAHLEPEILIIDEVLAVGDAAFQVKAIGKMKEISEGGGRTVLLVSHNMASISKLCKKCMVLKHGQTDFYGRTEEAVAHYLQTETINSRKIIDVVRHETAGIKVHRVTINQQESAHLLIKGERETIELTFDVSLQDAQKISMKASLENALGQKVVFFAPGHFDRQQYLFDLTAGRYQLSAKFTLPYLNKGVYYLSIYLINSGVKIHARFPKAIQITCLGVATKQGKTFQSTKKGAVVLMGSMAAERYETLNINACSNQ